VRRAPCLNRRGTRPLCARQDDRRLQLDAKFEVLEDFRESDCAFWRGLYDAASK
jgi:hypothetical protein